MGSLPATTVFFIVLAVLLAPFSIVSGQALEERFEGSFPPDGWTVHDSAGDGVLWMRNDSWGDANWTSGSGLCAEVSSDHSPELDFDTQLISPSFIVPENGLLFFRANYANFMANDRFEVSLIFGVNHITILSWTSDQGDFESTPGVETVIPLPPFVMGEEITLQFSYRDDTSHGDAYYIQIDDVIVGDESPVKDVTWGKIKNLYR
ncbi:choice-of-anchor J domain-containing protein [bacterium]|nr:choice-of-anchor J domain-containing protein [bacterium]